MLKTYCINHLGMCNKRPKDGRRGEKVYAKQYQTTISNSPNPNCILFRDDFLKKKWEKE